jgi:hypothetical protein
MAWAAEALEHAGVPQPQRPVSKAERTLHRRRLVELGHEDAKVRTEVATAERMVKEAVRLIGALSPNSPTWAWNQVWTELGQAINQLLDASTRLMAQDTEPRPARFNEGRPRRMRQPNSAVIKRPGVVSAGPNAPFRPKRPGGRRLSLFEMLQQVKQPKRQFGSTTPRPAPNQGPRAPGAR